VRVSEVIHFYEAILAVSAILVWHFFFVIVKPGTYPMSWIWLSGRMPLRNGASITAARPRSFLEVEVLPPSEGKR